MDNLQVPVLFQVPTLTPEQQKTIHHFRVLHPTAAWAVSEADPMGTVTVFAVDKGSIWEIDISHEGMSLPASASIDPETWQTGIDA